MMVIRPVERSDVSALMQAQLDALKCHAGDRVRLVRLCAEEKTA